MSNRLIKLFVGLAWPSASATAGSSFANITGKVKSDVTSL